MSPALLQLVHPTCLLHLLPSKLCGLHVLCTDPPPAPVCALCVPACAAHAAPTRLAHPALVVALAGAPVAPQGRHMDPQGVAHPHPLGTWAHPAHPPGVRPCCHPRGGVGGRMGPLGVGMTWRGTCHDQEGCLTEVGHVWLLP
jgi:hypothetical protein